MHGLRVVKAASCLLAAAFCAPAGAVYFDSLIYDMEPGESFISRPIVNDTPRTNLYTISSYKIDKPGRGGENRIIGGPKEVVYSPLKFTVQAEGKEYFKLFYRGPQDGVERYYRVVFKEAPVQMFPLKKQNKYTGVLPVVAMSTVLVVRPRNINLKFDADERTGTIRNTGNTFFRVIIQKGCNGDDVSSTQFYMLPGETYRDPIAVGNNKKYVVALGRYHPLGKGCF